MAELIEVTREGRVEVIRLNRPQQLNALNQQLAHEVVAAAEAAAADRDVGCILLTGGDKVFAAGADIAEMNAMSADDVIERDFFSIWERFAQVRTPKVAAVNGYALGGGCEIMMMCDFAIAGQGARFGQPEIKLGIIAGMGGTQRMTRLIGRARAADMHLTGRLMDAEEALAAGLVARVVPDEVVQATAMEAAQTIAGYARQTARMAREAVARAEDSPLSEGLLFERRAFQALFARPEREEGMSAFMAKRKPRFH